MLLIMRVTVLQWNINSWSKCFNPFKGLNNISIDSMINKMLVNSLCKPFSCFMFIHFNKSIKIINLQILRQKWFRIIGQLIKYSIPFLLVLLLIIDALIIHSMIISFDHPFDRYLFIIFYFYLILTFIRLTWIWTWVYAFKSRGFIWLWVARLRFRAKLVWLIRSLIHVFLRT